MDNGNECNSGYYVFPHVESMPDGSTGTLILSVQPHKIMIVDSQTIMRDGLQALLSSEANYEVVGTMSDGRSAIDSIASLEPDIILMDLSMPGPQRVVCRNVECPRRKDLSEPGYLRPRCRRLPGWRKRRIKASAVGNPDTTGTGSHQNDCRRIQDQGDRHAPFAKSKNSRKAPHQPDAKTGFAQHFGRYSLCDPERNHR